MERGQPGEQREADAQVGGGGPAEGGEGVPGRVHLLHVRHEGGPPAGPPGGGRAGVHEERQVAFGEDVEQRGDAGEPRASRTAVAGSCDPAGPSVEVSGEPGGVGLAEGGRRPGAEQAGEGEGVLVVGVDDRPRLGRRGGSMPSGLDSDTRARSRPCVQREPPGEVVVAGFDLVGGLAVQVEGPAVKTGRGRAACGARPRTRASTDAGAHRRLILSPFALSYRYSLPIIAVKPLAHVTLQVTRFSEPFQ